MSIRDFLEAHPLSILLGVVVAAGSTTAGVVSFVDSSRYNLEKKQIEISHEREVSTLKDRLVSIERRIGDDDLNFFDVSKLVITKDKVKALDGSYNTAEGAKFYYTVPNGNLWKYSFISEGEYFMMKIQEDRFTSQMSQALKHKNFHLWAREEKVKIYPHVKDGKSGFVPDAIIFFPMVAVQVLEEDDFVSGVTSLDRMLEDNNIDQITKTGGGSEIAEEIATLIEGEEILADSSRDVDRKIELEEKLSQYYRGDLVLRMLSAVITASVAIEDTYEDTRVEINTIQKKGNVLYIQMNIEFESAGSSKGKSDIRLTVEREIFMVANSENFYLVQVEVPSADGRSDAYSWVGQWLSGIRIPI
ncbi:MAG: hypothetical protein WDZ83_10745 [Rhizobiaceae bacterium]